MEKRVEGEFLTVSKSEYGSHNVRIPKVIFKQISRSDRINIFMKDNSIYIYDAQIKNTDEGGEFKNSKNKNGAVNNLIILKNEILDKIGIKKGTILEMYTDYETYIRLSKSEV